MISFAEPPGETARVRYVTSLQTISRGLSSGPAAPRTFSLSLSIKETVAAHRRNAFVPWWTEAMRKLADMRTSLWLANNPARASTPSRFLKVAQIILGAEMAPIAPRFDRGNTGSDDLAQNRMKFLCERRRRWPRSKESGRAWPHGPAAQSRNIVNRNHARRIRLLQRPSRDA